MYEKFFGLNEKPFNVTPDPRFLYLSPNHQEALASMLYGIKEKRGFVSIVGEIGTGKTTLLHALFKELDNDVKTVFIFNTRINFNQLLQNILLELDITPVSNNKALLIKQLNDFLIEKLSLNDNVALIIDEAQNLSASLLEELRMLSNLETDRNKLIQIILVAQPELDIKLRSHNLRQLKQRIGINCYLIPLTHEEQLQYITHRLSVAGSKDNHVFSKKALELICKHSGGIPRIINILCDNALLSAFGKGRKEIDADIVEEIISDYERPGLPVNKNEELPNNFKEEKNNIFTTARVLLASFVCTLTIFFTLGISDYRSNFNSFNHFVSSVFTGIATSQLNIERPVKESHIQSTLDKPQLSSSHTMREEPIQEPNNELQNSDTVIEKPTIENISPADQIPPTPDSEFVPSNALSMKRNHKSVFAKPGDMVSALAIKEYGVFNDDISDFIKSANPEIENLDRIDVGQKIILPLMTIKGTVVEISKGVFSIHVATFSSHEGALQYYNRSAMKEYPVLLQPVKITGTKPSYRVMIGSFSSKSQALEFAKTI